jgi:hypothetical protein
LKHTEFATILYELQKIQKVTGGLTRLASRTKAKKEESIRVKLRLHYGTVVQWTEQNVALVRELASTRKLQYQQTYQHTQRYVYQVKHFISYMSNKCVCMVCR